MKQSVIVPEDLHWSFDGGQPSYCLSFEGTYARSHNVDPTPGYRHDFNLVEEELKHLQHVAPLPMSLAIFILGHEVVGRTNAFHCDEAAYSRDDDTRTPVSIIVMSGKRIPIHPAMTRYLVAHEYGHAVEAHLARQRKDGVGKYRAILEDYVREVRPDGLRSYGPGKWHSNVGELFANDFRILIAKREVEFWPHPGFSRPEENFAAIGWWQKVREDLFTPAAAA